MPKVLVVEDDRDVLEIIVDIIKRHNIDVVTAQDGEEALEKYAKEQPDLVMADIRMPKLNGIDLSHTIKKRNPNLPIILFSGQYPDLVEDLIEKKLQCDHVLFKPFVQMDIVESLRLFLGHSF
jgi:two-component system response regulator VicR